MIDKTDEQLNQRARAFIDGHVTTLPLPVQLHGITEAEKASAAELCADFATQETLALTDERDKLIRKNAVLMAAVGDFLEKFGTNSQWAKEHRDAKPITRRDVKAMRAAIEECK